MTKFIFMFKVKCYIKKTNSHSEILFVFLMFIPAYFVQDFLIFSSYVLLL